MWFAPEHTLPADGEPVICITAEGDVVWLKRMGDGWLESDALGQNRGNLQRAPLTWTHPPLLRSLPEAMAARDERYRQRLRAETSGINDVIRGE